jgi:addiction module HigA family antidote
MIMNNPPHVGEILRDLYLEPLGVTVTEAANQLGVTRQSLSKLVNEQMGISAEMAIRLSKAFNNSPEFWMNLEKQYELWMAMEKYKDIKVDPFDKAA